MFIIRSPHKRGICYAKIFEKQIFRSIIALAGFWI
jgi:hypothetical protein